MQRIQSVGNKIFGDGGSTVDGNKLYSILLDARASKVSDSMYDVAENLVTSEKDNAKTALDQLWNLKKDIQGDSDRDASTVDLLIQYYQDKLNVLRDKEEIIKKISKDSRSLLEEKRKRDSEIASVKQQIEDCSTEIDMLNNKLHKLKVKEQELTLVGGEVGKELHKNANEVVNGLYEIILSHEALTETDAEDEQPLAEPSGKHDAIEDIVPMAPPSAPKETAASQSAPAEVPRKPEALDTTEHPQGAEVSDDTDVYYLTKTELPAVPSYPKSVVKTTKGVVIGEYYYDPKVYKNRRQYVYNSSFLRSRLSIQLRALSERFDQGSFSEAVQTVQDALTRVGENSSLHFEVSTNEILNANTLKDLLHHLRTRQWDQALQFCNRLQAKINALGSNYGELLKGQMNRISK